MAKLKELEKPMHFKEVVEFLGMGTDFVYKELQRGRLAGRKLGKEWIVNPSDLPKYLATRPSNQKRVE